MRNKIISGFVLGLVLMSNVAFALTMTQEEFDAKYKGTGTTSSGGNAFGSTGLNTPTSKSSSNVTGALNPGNKSDGFSGEKRMEFNGNELYYTPSVTLSEANELKWYWMKYAPSVTSKSFLLNKTESTYELWVVIKKGLENDREYLQLIKGMASVLSRDVFRGSEVDVHLCNERWETIRVVVSYLKDGPEWNSLPK